MKTIETTLYNFSELSDKAKDRAINWYREGSYAEVFGWASEYRESLEAFCSHFGVKATDWSVSTCSHSYVETDATNANFRGVTLASIDRDNMPTGFCADCDLWMTFHDEFKRTGSAFPAFNSALEAWVRSYVADMEDADSDESIAEHIEANEYTFLENGERFG